MYGLKPIGRIDGKTNFAIREFTNGAVAIHQGDPVKLTNGALLIAAADDKILGVALEDAAIAATGVQVCVDPMMVYLMDQDNDTNTFGKTTATYSPGNYFSIISSTGACQIDTSTGSATTGEILAISYNPQIPPVAADVSVCEVMIVGLQFVQGATNT